MQKAVVNMDLCVMEKSASNERSIPETTLVDFVPSVRWPTITTQNMGKGKDGSGVKGQSRPHVGKERKSTL